MEEEDGAVLVSRFGGVVAATRPLIVLFFMDVSSKVLFQQLITLITNHHSTFYVLCVFVEKFEGQCQERADLKN